MTVSKTFSAQKCSCEVKFSISGEKECVLRRPRQHEQGGSLLLMMRACLIPQNEFGMELVAFLFSMKKSCDHSQIKEREFCNMATSSWILLYARTINMLSTGV